MPMRTGLAIDLRDCSRHRSGVPHCLAITGCVRVQVIETAHNVGLKTTSTIMVTTCCSPPLLLLLQWSHVHTDWLRQGHLQVCVTHPSAIPFVAPLQFGHCDAPRSWARHLAALRAVQARTRGITEFVPLPFVHMEAPIYLKGEHTLLRRSAQ